MDEEKTPVAVTPWVIIGTVVAIIIGVWAGSHYFAGCSDLFNACVVGKK